MLFCCCAVISIGFWPLPGLVRSVSVRARSLLTWWACSKTNPWWFTWVGPASTVILNQPTLDSTTFVWAPPKALVLSRSVLIAADQSFLLESDIGIEWHSLPPLEIHTQVEPVTSSLNTNDVFLLKVHDSCYMWKGKGMTQEEVTAAKVVSQLMGGVTEEVEENSEPGESLTKIQEKPMHIVCVALVFRAYPPCFSFYLDEFWAALGGKGEYQNSPTLRNMVKKPRLFAVSNSTGRLIVRSFSLV